ncbi:MAG TPA: hypothetical protein VIM65_03745 [Cyclobacteriaceae bacterium]
MKKFYIIILLTFLAKNIAVAQVDSTLFKRIPKDTSYTKAMNMDAIYNRPFLSVSKVPVAVGGYVEADYSFIGENGTTEGHSFRLPRLTMFLASAIHRKIKFLSEIEFEEGGREVNIEFASLDFSFHSLLNLRGGVVMNPIGAFNQNHDGPKWEFIDRPVAMTQMLPATWSTVGFGLYGRHYTRDWGFGYEFYLTNGFDDNIINNTQNKTFLPASKANAERFDESSNGEPLVTSKISARNNKIGEIGISYMGGVYNKYKDDGIVLDRKRRVEVIAVDFNTKIPKVNTRIVGEWAWVIVDVPTTFTQQYGSQQRGGFVDIVQPVLKKEIFGFENAVLNVACRLEYTDWNVGKFKETGGNIADDMWAVSPAISFRPTSQTVIRLNYKIMKQHDLLGNPPSSTHGIQFGISSYF